MFDRNPGEFGYPRYLPLSAEKTENLIQSEKIIKKGAILHIFCEFFGMALVRPARCPCIFSHGIGTSDKMDCVPGVRGTVGALSGAKTDINS